MLHLLIPLNKNACDKIVCDECYIATDKNEFPCETPLFLNPVVCSRPEKLTQYLNTQEAV